MATGGLCITSEEKNYNKICHLLIGIGTNQIRSVFDRCCKMLSNSTAGLLQTNEQRLQTLRTSRSQKGGPPKIINDTQWRLMYPTPPAAANSEQFDITLLMILLRNICGLKSPNDHVWTRPPYSSDVSVEADLVRMREFRNKLQHMPGTTIKDSEFERLWFDISVVLVRLGAKQNDIDELKLVSMDPSETERHQQTLKQWKELDDELKDRLDRIDEKQDKALENDEDFRLILQKLMQSGMSLASDADSAHQKRDDQCLDAANKCGEELRQYYKEYLSNITQLPWWDGADKVKLDQVYVDLGLETKKEGISIQNQNLFSSREDCENPKRILIEADAGHGKSTLCKKLALDWAQKKIFDQFKLVFFLALRHLQGRQISLKDAFFESLLPEDSPINREDLWDFIKSHQSEVLFILDGLDEVHRDHLPVDVQTMLLGMILRNCKMIFTSRIIREKVPEDQYDTLLLIRPFKVKSLEEFVRLQFQSIGQTLYADSFLHQFNQIRPSSVDLLFLMQTPLNALLVCKNWLKMEN
ncbi:NACHT, LRR and PYD domains-containing protein 1 homolog [Ptychodera flava]|uniref:NACHT, LRR and PYD domains-containing protein 1 homolog n=1 Tax=Ptychodera flava TaxID=63121 RepID=UPI003969CE0B